MSDPGKAVFLSYASQDAAAAKGIADALRSSGVEVWFDAEGGLEHGDEWDAKIRRQIKECVLFLPVISANTEAREEGYFRLEWDLAAERARNIASGVAFILPIVIDDTPEADALVPDRFRAVQWTRLRGREVPPEVKQRLLKLWSHRTGAIKQRSGTQPADTGDRRPEAGNERQGRNSGRPRAFMPMVVGAVALVAVAGGAWFALRPSPPASSLPPPVPLAAPTPPASGLPSPAAPATPLTEAGRLIERAWIIFEKVDDASNEEWDLAEEMAGQATKLEPRNAEAWAVQASVTVMPHVFGHDSSSARLGRATKAAQLAVNLDPQSVDARAALANCYRLGDASLRAEAERIIRALAAEQPGNKRVQRIAGNVLRTAGKFDDSMAAFDRALALPGGDPYSRFGKERGLRLTGRFVEGEALVDEALVRNPGPAALLRKLYYVSVVHDDLDRAAEFLLQVPTQFLLREQGANQAISIWLWRRDADRGIALLRQYPGETVFGTLKGAYIGGAYRMSGRAEAARLEWQAVLKQVEARLAAQPNDAAMLYHKTILLASLGDRPGAEATWKVYEELQPTKSGAGYFDKAFALTALGRPEEAIAALETSIEQADNAMVVMDRRMDIRHNPFLDPLRSQPRFQALLEELNRRQIGKAPLNQRSAISGQPSASGPKSQTPDPGPSNPAQPDSKSIAVLPFASLSTDKDNEFFADGVHDDVITNLAKIRDLKVISRTSVLAYRDTASRNLKKIAAELGVATVLEGSVRRIGNKVRMNAQLIDARTDAHLWADNFEGDASDIFALQASLAQKIAAQLKATLTSDEKSLMERRPTENSAAYEHYLRGRVLEERLTQNSRSEGYQEAIAAYEQAVALDPTFAFAYTRMARLHGTMYWFAQLDPSPARKALVEAAVEAAQRHAPETPETHYARGVREYFVNNDWERALVEYRQAEAGLPNDSQLQALIAFSLRRLGRWTEALENMERSLALGPRDLYIASQISGYYRSLRRIDTAVAAAQRCVELFPQDNVARTILALARFDRDNDLPAYRQAMAKVPPLDNDPLGLTTAYERAMFASDLAAADRALADPRLTGITDQWVAVVTEPVAFHRARVAWLRGDAPAARRFAEEALAEFNRRSWTPRQRPYLAMAVCEANAYAGRTEEVLRDIPAVLENARRADAYSCRIAYDYVGQAYLVLGRRDDAFTMLRAMVSGPSYRTPNVLRIDPLWSRLKDDPRFEEVLKSAKPL